MADSLDDRHGSSDQYYDPYCDLCFDDKGRNHKALGYCRECFQFLCSACNDVHKNLQCARRHTVLHGDDMPQSQSAKPPRFEDCETHPKHVNDQFCFEHQILLCPACSSSNHNNCTVMSVDDACKYVQTSDVESLFDKLKNIKINLETVLSTMDKTADTLKREKENANKEAERLHQEMISKADELFEKMKTDINLKYQSFVYEVAGQNKQIKEVVSRLDRALNDIAKEKDKSIDTKLFLRVQDILSCKEFCKTNIQNLERTFRVVSLSMTPSKELLEFLSSEYALGTLSIFESKTDARLFFPDVYFPASPNQPPVANSVSSLLQSNQQFGLEKPQKLGTYNIKLDDDDSGCCITGIAVTKNGRKLMVDGLNNKVKLFSKDMKILSSVTLPSSPMDITMVGDHEAVVSANHKIVRIQISDSKIIIKQTIPLSFNPYGITKCKDKLLVTAPWENPASVKLIDLAGVVHWSATTDKQQIIFGRPYYVRSFDDQRKSSVIVTDESKNTLTILTVDTGKVISRRQLEGKQPYGIATDTNGNIFVCYYGSAQVAALSGDLAKERILLPSQDLSGDSQAIAYDDKANQLIISDYSRNHVDIFQL